MPLTGGVYQSPVAEILRKVRCLAGSAGRVKGRVFRVGSDSARGPTIRRLSHLSLGKRLAGKMVHCSAAFRTGSQAGSRGVRCVLADTKREVLGPSVPDASLFISRHFRRQQSFVGLLPLASACCGKAASSFRPASNHPPPATRLGAPGGTPGARHRCPAFGGKGARRMTPDVERNGAGPAKRSRLEHYPAGCCFGVRTDI